MVLAVLGGPSASAQTAPGPPMIPLAPRPPAPPAPPCDPTWREVARPPPDASPHGAWIVTGGRIVWVGWGYAAVRASDGTWAAADPSRVPAIALDDRRRIVFSHALARGHEVYVVGTRLTVLRYDGTWHLEHRDLAQGERRTHAARLETCDGRLRAIAHGVGIERRDDGTWARLPRAALRACEAPRLEAPRPSERCGNWMPGLRIASCAAGRRLWSVRRARWLPLPDEMRVRRWATVIEHDDGIDLVDDDGVIQHSHDGTHWQSQSLPAPALRLSMDGSRLYAPTDDALYARDVCR
ncbi:MAG: hypothetical protein R3B82_21245 [Sandaracinaceae bacterium]